MDTLSETLTHAVANATLRVWAQEDEKERRSLTFGEWRAVILATTFKWVGHKLVRAARRGFNSFGSGMPVFDAYRHHGRVWDY